MTWAEEEFGGADLGDKRLNKRLVLLADRLGEQPSASIPEACRGAAEMHAAYRFLGREAVDWRELMQPHWDASARRMQSHPVVLCIQDTTELDFEGKSAQGLGPLSYEAQRGMYVHPTYAVTPQRLPLGILDAWMWARPLDVVESQRWIEGYERLAERAGHLPATRLVYVADREADILELMQRAHALAHPVDYLLRARHNRCLPQGGKLWETTLASAAVVISARTVARRSSACVRYLSRSSSVRCSRLRRVATSASMCSAPSRSATTRNSSFAIGSPSGSAASSTRPIEVHQAGRREPGTRLTLMILCVATRCT